MSDARTPPIGPDPIRPDASAARAASRRAAEPSAAFQALLERLTARAAELEEKSRTVDDAAQLSPAVDAARASLEDAETLSERLLEVYRAARHGAGEEPGP